MKFGCCTKAENYRALAACGYDFIELSGHEVRYMEQAQWQELVQEIHRTGVPCIGFNDYCHQQPAIVGEGFDPEAVREFGFPYLVVGDPASLRLAADRPMAWSCLEICGLGTVPWVPDHWGNRFRKTDPAIDFFLKDPDGSVQLASVPGAEDLHPLLHRSGLFPRQWFPCRSGYFCTDVFRFSAMDPV